jgi:hypothetical protein
VRWKSETKSATKGRWKSRSVEKSKQRTFPPRLEIRKNRGFPLSPPPRRLLVISYPEELKNKTTQTRHRPRLTYCVAKMALTMGSTFTCTRGVGNKYRYVICNPETGKPWEGDPKQRVIYEKKREQSDASSARPYHSAAQPIQSARTETDHSSNADSLEKHGVCLTWGT